MKNEFLFKINPINRFNPLLGFILLILSTVSFMAPALWNGFPLIFTDSLSYLTSGIELVAPVDRPIFYGIYLRFTNYIFDLWGAVFFQSALLIFLLMKFSMSIAPDFRRVNSLAWILASSILGIAPWFSSQISPDIFTACLFLTYMIWVFSYENSSRLNAIYIGLLMIAVQCMHSGNIMIGFILYVCITIVLAIQKKSLKSIKKFSVLILITLSISTALIIVSNVVFHQGLTFNRWGKVIFLARLLEDGPALKYLKAKCSDSKLNTCIALPLFEDASQKEVELGLVHNPELKNMILNSLLWDGGINKIGGLDKVNSEASQIIFGTIYEYPKDVLISILKNTFDQLKTFTVGNQLGSTAHLDAINNFIKLYFPEKVDAYVQSMQFQDKVKPFTAAINPFYTTIIYISIIFLFAVLIKSCIQGFKSMNKTSIQILILSVFGFMVANAVVTGGLSAVFDRYQGRVIWLLPAVALFLIALRTQNNAVCKHPL